MESLNEDIDH